MTLLKNSYLLILFVFLLLSEASGQIDNAQFKQSASYANSSLLSGGNWVKIAVDKSGVYRIDYQQLSQICSLLGYDISKVNSQNIALFGQESYMLPEANLDYNSDDLRQIPVDVVDGNDGILNNNDYILFYYQGPDRWILDVNTQLPRFVKNIYSDNSYLFFSILDSSSKKISIKNQISSPASLVIEKFDDYLVHELEKKNLLSTGQLWFGESLHLLSSLNLDMAFYQKDANSQIYLEVGVGVQPATATSIEVSQASSKLLSFNFPLSYDYSRMIKSSVFTSSENGVKLQISSKNQGSGESYLDYVILKSISIIRALNKQFLFRSSLAAITPGVKEYRIQNPNQCKEVWNVSDIFNVQKISLSENTSYKSFKDDSSLLQEYVLLPTTDDFYSILSFQKIENQDLHSMSACDYLIISHPSLIDAAQNLADFHRSKGLDVHVVDVEKIYNEYSSGRQDLIAIRQFVRNVYLKGGPGKLKYLLLFGDASFDFKNRIVGNNNLLPSYQSYSSLSKSTSFVSDDYFGILDSHEGSNLIGSDLIDIAIGRIPAENLSQASDIVEKIISYNNSSQGDWKTKVQFVADDVAKDAWEAALMEDSEALSTSLRLRNSSYKQQKVYIDIFDLEKSSSGNYSPIAHQKFMENIQNGNLITNYFGHGNETVWTGEGLFGIDDIENLSNKGKLPLFITVTCEFSRFDNPELYTAGEKLLSYSKGGGIALISTTREITVSFGSRMNEKILQYLLPDKNSPYVSIGEALKLAKNSFNGYQSRRTVTLLGDPAMTLAYPKESIAFSKSDYSSLSALDTVKSLSKVNLKGQIIKSGNLDNSFNGKAYVEVYDKLTFQESLDNNNFGINIPYWTQNNIIHRGEYSVANGEFDIEFIVPKDINYSFAAGKIFAYANTSDSDAFGDNNQFTVGGIQEGVNFDYEGPKLELYLNDVFFVNGGVCNPSPIIYCEISDQSGINTVGTGIGHNMVLNLNGPKGKKSIVVNNFYSSNLDDFTRGNLKYQLIGLDEGDYTAELVVWDVFNNSSTAEINFRVIGSDKKFVDGVDNFPNPFSDKTNFRIFHNQGDELLDVFIEVYNLQGLKVKSIERQIQTKGFVISEIEWDGKSDNNNKLSPGTYVYSVRLRDQNGQESNFEFNKLIIN